MSTLKLSGVTSGSSIIKAPDSGSTGVIFTLPASTGTLLTTTGSAASLTAIPAANITGTLPAIDGSNLTGVGIAGIDDQSSSNDDQITITDTAVTINEDGDDVDFRVESDTHTNALFVDGGTGNVGIGVNPKVWNTGWSALQIGGMGSISSYENSGDTTGLVLSSNAYLKPSGTWSYIGVDQATAIDSTDGKWTFKTTNTASAGSADAAITWQNTLEILQYDQSPDMYRGVQIVTDSLRSYIGTFRQTTSTSSHMNFFNTNGNIGSIKTNGTATSFNTSSDYRLKENVDYTWDATTRLKQLKPARFNFISDEDNTLVDGFLAHEVENIVPEAISGTKDATETLSNAVVMPNGISVGSGITEEEWTTGKADDTYPADSTWKASHTQNVNQSIDQSKLVPLLVKTIQELEARITALEA